MFVAILFAQCFWSGTLVLPLQVTFILLDSQIGKALGFEPSNWWFEPISSSHHIRLSFNWVGQQSPKLLIRVQILMGVPDADEKKWFLDNQASESLAHSAPKCSYRLVVRTAGLQPANISSNLVRSTKKYKSLKVKTLLVGLQ